MATSRPDLSVWVVTGDGDALSIGGNHLIHALRRNVPLKILLFNNQIYGLTKGQYSPTSEEGKVTKSTPFGSQDHPFNPVSLALGAEASFVARTVDTDKEHMAETLRAAAAHQGTAFVEIYQNCNVFNDGAFDAVRAKGEKEPTRSASSTASRSASAPRASAGWPAARTGAWSWSTWPTSGEDALLVHDAHRREPSLAFELAHLAAAPDRPDARRGLPRGGAPGVRRGAGGVAGRGAQPGSARGARERCCTPAKPGRSRSRPDPIAWWWSGEALVDLVLSRGRQHRRAPGRRPLRRGPHRSAGWSSPWPIWAACPTTASAVTSGAGSRPTA